MHIKDGSSVNDITYWFWTPPFKASPKGGVIKNSIKLTAHVMKEGFAVEGREVKNEMLLEAQCKILQSFEDRIWGDVLKVSLMLLKAPEP